MKTRMTNLIIIFIICFTPCNSFSKENQIYKHSSLDIQFEASKNWINIPRPEDKLIYELISPDSNMHVILWYTETEQSGLDYLEKMADMKNLIVEEKPSQRQINNQDVWVKNALGFEQKMRISSILAVVPHGKSEVRPKENRLFIIQIWCLEKNFEKYKSTMENILTSIQLVE